MKNTLRDSKPFHNIPDSFAERHLTIREDMGDHIFLTQEGGLGIVWEFPGIYDEPKNLNGSDGLVSDFSFIFKALRELSRGIPDGQGNITIQIYCSQRESAEAPEKMIAGNPVVYSDSATGKILDQYEKDLFKMIRPVRRKFYLAVHWNPERKTALTSILRSAIAYFVPEKKQIKELDHIFEASKREFLEKIRSFELQMQSGFPLRRLSSEELIGYIQDILHCGTKQKVYPESTDIHKAIYNPPLIRKKDGLYWDEKSIKAFILHNATEPGNFAFGLLRHFMDALPVKNWDMVWCFTDGSFQARSSFNVAKVWYAWAGNGQEKVRDYEDFEQSVSYSRPFGTQSLRLLVYNATEAHESQIRSHATNFLSARMLKEEEIPVHMISCSLPLNLRKEWHKVKGATREVRLEDAASFWPVYDGPSALEGTRWLISRCGTPTCFSPFTGFELRTAAILGQARKGKSSWTSVWMCEFLETQNGIVRGIDARTSYKKSSDIAGGRIIDFSIEALLEDPFSPFAGVDSQDSAEMSRLFNIIVTALHLANSNISFDSTHEEILKQSLARAYKTHRKTAEAAGQSGSLCGVHPHPVWQDVKNEFDEACQVLKSDHVKNLEEAKSDLVKWGLGLSEGGKFGYIFSAWERKEPISPTTRVVIYDLGATDKTKEADQILATQIAATRIKRDISYNYGDRSVPKMVIFEEFGLLVRGGGKAAEYMSAFAADIIKSGPKTNTFVVAVTNSVRDYCTEVGQDLWSNASQKIFLPMGDMVSLAKEAWGDQFTEAEWQIIASLKLEKHLKRSAAYIRSRTGHGYRGSVFLPLTPLLDALITTDDHQKKLYDRLTMKKGYTPSTALEYMAKHHPFGKDLS
ncbi:MAG: hypothetical protein H6618_05105 [Deltaproteobacteria bacterium]|nr:hypothetical protein [Deltaproteobacteria bacterium]